MSKIETIMEEHLRDMKKTVNIIVLYKWLPYS